MRIRALFIAVLLLFSAVGIVSAAANTASVASGDIRLGFTPKEGFKLDYKGSSVFTESCLWVDYFDYGSDTISALSRDIPGGKEIDVHCTNPIFDGLHNVKVIGNTVTFDFKYHLLPGVEPKSIQYNVGFLSAPLITGRGYQTEAIGGSESGIVPLKALGERYFDGCLVKNPFKKIVFNSRIGKISVQAEGVPNNLQMYDWRGLHVTWAEKAPVFLLGAPVSIAKAGHEVHSVVTVTIEPLSSAPKPEITASEPSVREVDGLRKTTPQPVIVIPEPQKMEIRDGDFRLTDGTQVVVGDSAKEEDLRGAKSFAEEVQALYGIRLRIVRASKASGENLILVGETSTNARVASASKAIGLAAPSKDEGYALSVDPHRIVVLGHDRRGTYYGMQTLKQLVKVAYDSTTIQGCRIDDYPSLKFRGAHLYTGNKALPFHEKLIDRIFSRFKMNNMVYCVDQIQWKTDPKMAAPFSMSQADMRADIRYAREHFMDSTPQISSLGHAEWAFVNKRHMDLAEDKAHPYVLCPSKQGTYDFLYKIFDEAISLFDHPKYLHIGHDEATWGLAKFPNDPECRKNSVPDLFLMNTLRLYDHLKKKGVGTMMWGDMMLAPGSDTDACNMPDEKDAARLRRSIPKDVVVTDWHYDISPAETFKSLQLFQNEGLKTIASTWYTPANIRNFSQAAKDDRSFGLLQTTWAGTNSNAQNLIDCKEQFTAFVLAADYAWNSGKTDLDNLPYDPEQVFFTQWDRTPVKRCCINGFAVDLGSMYNVPLSNASERKTWIGKSEESDLSSTPVGDVRLRDDFFTLAKSTADDSAIRLSSALDGETPYPSSVTVQIDRAADSLLFLHTCAWSDTAGRIVGLYKVNYEDGSFAEIPLVYRLNIASWTDNTAAKNAAIAWRKDLADGQRVSIREMEWKNPHPGIKIRSIEMRSTETNAGPVLLGISGITAK
jgi:hypothetical protein